MPTDELFSRDAYAASFTARVEERDDADIALDRTAFYPTGGGQPHDRGTIRWVAEGQDGGDARSASVVDVRRRGDLVWHTLDGDVPPVGTVIDGELDWERRHALMRTHTALHILSGVIWHRYGVAVTGGNMEPLAARMDFEFDPLPEGFAPEIEELVNAEIAADRPVVVSFLPRAEAVRDADLIRTKADLVPEHVTELRLVEIVGLDRQADGGTHVRSTGDVGRLRVTKTESKGRGNKRIRVAIEDR